MDTSFRDGFQYLQYLSRTTGSGAGGLQRKKRHIDRGDPGQRRFVQPGVRKQKQRSQRDISCRYVRRLGEERQNPF